MCPELRCTRRSFHFDAKKPNDLLRSGQEFKLDGMNLRIPTPTDRVVLVHRPSLESSSSSASWQDLFAMGKMELGGREWGRFSTARDTPGGLV
ncbi:unnamed protein product [Mesocestoides corti]|uniref:PEROXIDASE_4 domain-containing protein n=1 Tax=Mesocestoides corti TaxID=53468 RepID=A0A0R3U1V4_MESCO|nr:unnamed protein product [Mesocestoides corti]